ncbi:reticulocyte-binding protein homolog 2a-like isoform X1 [Dreissena polymorpha]|nr:reticulocyte-binding protein homolog 2a-like isoform X1 [Dreissena polymorpha]
MGITIPSTTPQPTPDPRIFEEQKRRAQASAEQRRIAKLLANRMKKEQELVEQKRKEQALEEQKLKEQQLAEQTRRAQELVEQKLREQQMAEQARREQELAEQKLKEQQMAEQTRREQELAEQKIREQQMAEQKRREQELAEQKFREQQMAEQKRREQELIEQKLREQQLVEQRLREQQERLDQMLKELQLTEQRLKEQQQLAEQRLQEQQLREKMLAEQKLKDEKKAEQERLRAEQLRLQQQSSKSKLKGDGISLHVYNELKRKEHELDAKLAAAERAIEINSQLSDKKVRTQVIDSLHKNVQQIMNSIQLLLQTIAKAEGSDSQNKAAAGNITISSEIPISDKTNNKYDTSHEPNSNTNIGFTIDEMPIIDLTGLDFPRNQVADLPGIGIPVHNPKDNSLGISDELPTGQGTPWDPMSGVPIGGSIFGPSGESSGNGGSNGITNTNPVDQPFVQGTPIGPNTGEPLGPVSLGEPLGPNGGFAPGEAVGGGQEAQFKDINLNEILTPGPTGRGSDSGIRTMSGELLPQTQSKNPDISKTSSSTLLGLLSGLQTRLRPK